MQKRGKSLLWVSRLGLSNQQHLPSELPMHHLSLPRKSQPWHTQVQSPCSAPVTPSPHNCLETGDLTLTHTQKVHMPGGERTTQASPCRAEYPTWSSSCPHSGQASSRGLEQQSTNIMLTRSKELARTRGGWMHGRHLLLLFCREV